MPQATLKHGEPTTVDYTPGSAVTAGDVVVQGDVPMVAHVDVAANALGALAVQGAVYEVTGDAAIAVGKKVYWDDSNNKVTETASGNAHIGHTITACSGDDATCLIYHNPQAETAA